MTQMSSPIIFFGNERLATGVHTTAPTLQALIEQGYQVTAAVSHYEDSKSRNLRALEIADVAEQHHIPLLLPTKLKDVKEQLQSYHAAIGVLAAYGKIIPQEIIDIFPQGIINIHPSLLPLHRGSTPIEGAILAGDAKTGVSIMQLVQEMDAGPVYGQSEVQLNGSESKQDLTDRLLDIGQAMIIELLPGILNGSLVAVPQDSNRATYDTLISKADSTLDWHKPAVQLEREIRAFAGWPQSHTQLAGKDVIITKAHVATGSGKPGTIWKDGKNFGIFTEQNILVIDSLKPAGKPAMTAQAFLAGYNKKF